jgi:hypothetical protein
MTHVTWISGWGVAPEALQAAATAALPGAKHVFRAPRADAVDLLAGCDLLVGWSLGAWRILEAASRGMRFEGQVILLAPFIAFCSEYQLGGRCSLTQVKWLRRWLQRDPEAALKDFYSRAGLDGGLPYDADHLLEGLDRLAEDATADLRSFASAGLPSNWSAFVGDRDPLLDAATTCRVIKGCNVALGARHRFEDLILSAFEQEGYAV